MKSERLLLAVLLLIFTYFTWRGLLMFYSGDDMMNMHAAWVLNPWRLGKSLLMIWMPIYRPAGGAVYRAFYAVFGFHPAPLYVFCWLLLVANVVLAYRFFQTAARTWIEAMLALSITLVHGNFQDLYLSAGTIYDRLWFLFTVLGVAVYARMRREPEKVPVRSALLVCLLCILSMDAKESGVALPLLLACYECIFILPGLWREGVAKWLRSVAPLYGAMAVISLVFVFLRVRRTFELAANTAYSPHASVGLWLTHVAEYFGILVYNHVAFKAAGAGVLLALMAAVAVILRNRAMMFGWLFFVITITPVALISSRPGYVLYVPDLGLGMYFAAAIAGLARRVPRGEYAAFALVTFAITWFHVRNWPPPFDPRQSPEFRLTEQFRRDYPKLHTGSRLLFVSDEFPREAYDLLFNLRLMYRDPTIEVRRLQAPPDQQPDPKHPMAFDHIFAADAGRYVELDSKDPSESVRLHILRDYAVGREMDMARRDHSAYVVSGVMDSEGDDPGRWTEPKAKLKFDLYPAPAVFSAKFWVPDFVAKTAQRTLLILVNGKQIGAIPLAKDGLNEVTLPCAGDLISPSGFTIVDMNVENPYKDQGGQAFGVVLMRAGFEYQTRK